jgi:hypothetical protein
VTEVERFFRRLVSTLATTDPARLQGPLALDDITGSILPYRANRRALQVDTVEDYEAVLLRLCAGEGDLVRTEPEEARARFVQESRSPNPDLTALYSFEDVRLTLRAEPLLWALAPDPRADYGPPDHALPAPNPDFEPTFGTERESEPEDAPDPEPEPEPMIVLGAAPLEVLPGAEETEPGADDVPESRPTCLYCGGSLPTRRPVNFCPHCGQSQTQILCPQCRSEVEPGWRHCVNCGAAVGEA